LVVLDEVADPVAVVAVLVVVPGDDLDIGGREQDTGHFVDERVARRAGGDNPLVDIALKEF
jgi:hypothetical protein